MAVTFPQQAVDFLQDLDANNHKDWFQANKKRYERELKAPARALVEAVNEELAQIPPAHVTPAGKAISRINRDIRFSKDKTPYNTKVWAGFHDRSKPKGSSAGFYFGITLEDGVGVGCGAWQPPPEFMTSLREHIAEHHAELTRLLSELGGDYGPLKGPKYKRVPKPWDKDHPAGEYLKHKGMHLGVDRGLDLITSYDLVPAIAAHFRRVQPLVAFLDAGLSRGL